MYYREDPSRNRSLNGWSHNLWKSAEDIDHRATQIANRYIERFTQLIIKKTGVMPITGAEVNFTAIGVKEQDLIDFIHEETVAARQRLGQKVHIPRTRAEIAEELRGISIKTDMPPNHVEAYGLMEVNETETEEDIRYRDNADKLLGKEVVAMMRQQMIDQFEKDALKIVNDGDIDALVRVNLETLIDMLSIPSNRELLFQINPKAFVLIKDWLQNGATIWRDPNIGAIGRAYIDNTTCPGKVGAPEICTPPRLPGVTVSQVNMIKKLLIESTYRFRDKECSKLAQKVQDRFGNIDISFLDSDGYYNLPEHISFSLRRLSDPQASLKGGRVDMDEHDTNNLMQDMAFKDLLRVAFARFLPNERIFSIGNRFPYDEAVQNDLKEINVLTDRNGRAKGRVEIRNFNDATSNISLSMLSVMAVAAATIMTAAAEADEPSQKRSSVTDFLKHLETYLPRRDLPRAPGEAAEAIRQNSATLKMMIVATELLGGSEEDIKQAIADAEELRELVIERQRLLLQGPWGGRVRAREEAERGENAWQIANKRKEEVTESAPDSSPSL